MILDGLTSSLRLRDFKNNIADCQRITHVAERAAQTKNMDLRLRKFDMSSIADDKVICLIGKRDTGKSFLCKDLLYHHQDVPVGTVISATESANQFYGNMIPPLFIHDEYHEDIISKVLTRQKKVIDRMKEEAAQTKVASKIDPRAFLMLDDCLYDSSWTKSKSVRNIFMNGRHYKLMFIVTMQYALGIPPNLRTNIDYVFILRENIVANRKRIYESYAGMFPTFEIFCQVLDQTTENYECLVIHNNSKSNRLEDQVYWYKAEKRDDFKMGAQAFWDYHKQNYTTASTDDEFDVSQIHARRNRTLITVQKDDGRSEIAPHGATAKPAVGAGAGAILAPTTTTTMAAAAAAPPATSPMAAFCST